MTKPVYYDSHHKIGGIMTRAVLMFFILAFSTSAFASTTWLTCSNPDANLRRKQTNYPNSFSTSVWTYKATELKAIELSLPKSAIESFDGGTRKEIETVEAYIQSDDGNINRRTDTYFSSKVTISVKDGSDIDPILKISSITENVICRLRVIE